MYRTTVFLKYKYELKVKNSYIKNYVRVKNLKVEHSYDSNYKITGKIINDGDKILNSVYITYYFLDKDGIAVAEMIDDYACCNTGRNIKAYLKPQRGWKFFTFIDKYDVPQEWARKMKAKVNNIEFQKK